MPNSYPYNIPRSFQFDVKINGLSGNGECSFEEVSGLNVTIATEVMKEGGVNIYTQKLPGRAQYDNLVLKRGILIGSPLIDWVFDAVNDFTFTPKDIEVRLINEGNTTLMSWYLVNAYPVSLKTEAFRAQDNKLAVETLEIAYSYFGRTND